MRLRNYKNSDARRITDWVRDEEVYYQWCAGLFGDYPLTEDKINRYYTALQKNKTYWALTAEDEQGIVGHITMRFTDEEKKNLRLGFVLVDDRRRGQGLGKELVALAVDYAQQFFDPQYITLGVFVNNDSAKRCYEAVGFITDGSHMETYPVKDEMWDCIEMIYKRK